MTLTEALQLEAALLPILLPLIGLLVRAVWIKLPLASDQRALMEGIAAQVVDAVEKMYGSLPGPDKKAEAVKLLESNLSHLGIVGVPASVIDVLIEAAVASLPRPQ